LWRWSCGTPKPSTSSGPRSSNSPRTTLGCFSSSPSRARWTFDRGATKDRTGSSSRGKTMTRVTRGAGADGRPPQRAVLSPDGPFHIGDDSGFRAVRTSDALQGGILVVSAGSFCSTRGIDVASDRATQEPPDCGGPHQAAHRELSELGDPQLPDLPPPAQGLAGLDDQASR
jgi:hypothetical protein